ncbi:immunity 26/phosphotriesterase HocA family protein [Streptomyces umbrinus]|uniref:immunity 26/phosphotriesterase HocA family protein n=1 Tax=Streptomyces umbrinus TaxID=67370 RepID=UPI0034295137
MPLKKMKGQRRSHHLGDVFALRLEDSAYRFGRIVKIGESGPRGRFPGGILAYLYDVPAEAPEPDPGALTPDRLLMPPFFTMNWAWDKGYFRTVAHEDLNPTHLLKRHCFYDASIDGYVDENDAVASPSGRALRLVCPHQLRALPARGGRSDGRTPRTVQFPRNDRAAS